MIPRSCRTTIILSAISLVAGCATVGPSIGREELKSAHEFYAVKAKRHSYDQILRVRTVGEHLLNSIPGELRSKDPKPAIGIILDDLTLTSGRVFGIPGIEPDDPHQKKGRGSRTPWRSKKACLIIGVLPDSPASRAGIEAGDLLLKVGSLETRSVYQAVEAIRHLEPGSKVILQLEREGVRFGRELTVGTKPYPVSFNIEEEEPVNAFASPGLVTVTTGLLRFTRSDDELAVVMAHELAHLTKGHFAKGMGMNILAGAIGLIVGVAVDVVAPGVGDILSRVAAAGIRAPFSQDFEREADYVGLSYAYKAGYQIEAGIAFWDRFATELPKSLSESFFNTHPTSPERLLRLQKTIEELKKTPPRN